MERRAMSTRMSKAAAAVVVVVAAGWLPLATAQAATTAVRACPLPTFGPGASYDPKLERASFTPNVTNGLFPLKLGRSLVYTGVKDGKVAFTGSLADARKAAGKAQSIDLKGAAAYPGFIDAHGHLMGIGASIFLIAVGLILALAVNVTVSGIDINVIGWILVVVGVAAGKVMAMAGLGQTGPKKSNETTTIR